MAKPLYYMYGNKIVLYCKTKGSGALVAFEPFLYYNYSFAIHSARLSSQ